MKKKLLALFLLPLLTVTLVGCNDDEPENENDTYVEADDEVFNDENEGAEEGRVELDLPEAEIDKYGAIMENKEVILSTIEMLFPVENAFDVQVREDGALLLIPAALEWKDFQTAGFESAEVGDIITEALVLLSELMSVIGIEGVQINLMMVDSDEESVAIVADGEIGINLLVTSE